MKKIKRTSDQDNITLTTSQTTNINEIAISTPKITIEPTSVVKKQENIMSKFQSKGKFKLIKGSILNPEMAGLRFVLNTINMAGKIEGKQYTVFNKKWTKVAQEVKGLYSTKTGFSYKLGTNSNIAVQSDVWVINMLCKREDLSVDSKALEDCLAKVAKDAKYEKASVHVSSLLINEVPDLQNLLEKYLVNNGINVNLYEEFVA